jgi:hypothetical protein
VARYNTFKYGDGTHYGVSTPPASENAPFTWVFMVDWNGDGSYDGANEASRIFGYSLQRGRRNYVNPDGGGFDHMRPDSVTLSLHNWDRRYDPRNTGSPLSPNVYPGKRCQIAVYDNSTNPRTRYTRFTGYVDSITPMTGTTDVQIICKGNLQILTDQEFTSPEAHLKTTIHQAFVDLLKETDYPAGKSIDACAQPIQNFLVEKQGAGKVASDLADASIGQFFVDKNGKACYHARGHSYSTVMTIDEDTIEKEIIISQPWEGMFNRVEVTCQKQVKQAQSVLYFLPNPVELPYNETTCLYPTWERAADIVLPTIVHQLQPGMTLAESPQTLEAHQYKDGSGTDNSGAVSVVSNGLGPTGGSICLTTSLHTWLTKYEIRGRLWKVVPETFTYNSATRYGNHKFILDSPWLQDRNYAQAFANTLGAFLKTDRENITIQVINRPDIGFALDLLNKIHLHIGTYDINENYWAMGIDEEWLADTGQGVKTTYYLGKIITDSSSITAADVEVEEGTPLGFGGIPTVTEPTIVVIPVYHNDAYVGDASELNFLDSDYTP